jgi:DnaJ-domain-containing protein 1
MPSADDPRYTPSDPPTVEQLRAMLESVLKVEAYRTPNGDRSVLNITIDSELLHQKGGSTYSRPEQIVAALLDTVSRMSYFDSVTKDYASSERLGTTVADIQAFINNELKHVPPSGDLASIMRRRMYGETLQKLVELGVWRAAIDARRFQDAREKERKRQDEQKKADEAFRKMEEEINKAHAKARAERMEEAMRRQRERMEEAMRRHNQESWAGADRKRGSDDFKSEFEQAFHGFDWGGAFEESARRFDERMRGRSQNNSNSSGGKPKARNKTARPWHEVLEIPATSSDAEIKKAYRRMASKFHPDKWKDPDATARMTEINTAWNEIRDTRGIK